MLLCVAARAAQHSKARSFFSVEHTGATREEGKNNNKAKLVLLLLLLLLVVIIAAAFFPFSLLFTATSDSLPRTSICVYVVCMCTFFSLVVLWQNTKQHQF